MAKYHQNKEVSDAIELAVNLGWDVIPGSGHCFATLRCLCHDRTGCQVRVHSTPQNPSSHARKLIRELLSCECEPTHDEGE